MTESVFPLTAGTLYRFHLACHPWFEMARPDCDEYWATVSEPHDGQVDVRGEIKVPVDGELRVTGFRWGMFEEALPLEEAD